MLFRMVTTKTSLDDLNIIIFWPAETRHNDLEAFGIGERG